MGNKWGVIYNKTDKQIVYVIHKRPMDNPFQNLDSFKGEDLKTAIINDRNMYTAIPNRYTTSGLRRTQQDRYVSLKYSISGAKIEYNHLINKQNNFRVQILTNELINMSEQQCAKLKSLRVNKVIQNGDCGICGKANKLFQQEEALEQDLSCSWCSIKNIQIWKCNFQEHSLCDQCQKNCMLQNRWLRTNNNGI